MSEGLERRYRRWLLAYPPGYRRERGEEVLQTLLELGAPGQRRRGRQLPRAGRRGSEGGAGALVKRADGWKDVRTRWRPPAPRRPEEP